MEDFRDWYNDSDSTSSGPASQSRSTLEWQSAVDPSGNVFFVKRAARRQFSYPGSKSNSSLAVNYLQKTPSGILGKLIRRRSSRKSVSRTEEACEVGSKTTSTEESNVSDPKNLSDSNVDLAHKFGDQAHDEISSDKIESCVDSSCAGVLYTIFDQPDGSINENNVIYCYPPLDNILSEARGLTSFWYRGCKANVAYACEGEDVLLLVLPESRCNRAECRKLLNELCLYLKFIFQTLPRCYASPTDKFFDLDSFFDSLFHKLDYRSLLSSQEKLLGCFPAAVPYLVVPRDIQLQVEESLNELESNEIHFDEEDRRRFSIVGCAYFYKAYSVCSHLPKDDFVEVYLLMRESGVLRCACEGVKDLVYWKEVFPVGYARGLVSSPGTPYTTPTGRWFLLIVALQKHLSETAADLTNLVDKSRQILQYSELFQGHSTLVTLLESGGCSKKITGHPGPDPLYVEEAQATLRHIIKLGTAHFLSKWLGEREMPVSDGKLSLGRSSQSLSSFGESRNRGSVRSFDIIDYEGPAKDNMPVLGRRAERQLNEITHSSLNLADSTDGLDFNKESKSSDNVSEGSDIGRKLPGEGLILTNHRIAGSKYDPYFHYVHLDSSEGIVISNLFSETNCLSFDRIANNFKIQVRQIQDVFQSTVSFQTKSADLNAPLNKSMVAIKEYGTLFEMADSEEKTGTLLYWVTGRLITGPTPRELYVCYQDSCPQNIVELAFHLSLTSSR